MRAHRLGARTVGPATVIFWHKVYLWCHSGIGHIKNPNFKILAPAGKSLFLPKIKKYWFLEKVVKRGKFLANHTQTKKIEICDPMAHVCKKLALRTQPKKLKGHFLYLPILLYNTIGILVLSARAQTCSLDHRSGWADFLTQSVFMVSLKNRLYKKSKFQNLGHLLGNPYFCQKSRNPDF